MLNLLWIIAIILLILWLLGLVYPLLGRAHPYLTCHCTHLPDYLAGAASEN